MHSLSDEHPESQKDQIPPRSSLQPETVPMSAVTTTNADSNTQLLPMKTMKSRLTSHFANGNKNDPNNRPFLKVKAWHGPSACINSDETLHQAPGIRLVQQYTYNVVFLSCCMRYFKGVARYREPREDSKRRNTCFTMNIRCQVRVTLVVVFLRCYPVDFAPIQISLVFVLVAELSDLYCKNSVTGGRASREDISQIQLASIWSSKSSCSARTV